MSRLMMAETFSLGPADCFCGEISDPTHADRVLAILQRCGHPSAKVIWGAVNPTIWSSKQWNARDLPSDVLKYFTRFLNCPNSCWDLGWLRYEGDKRSCTGWIVVFACFLNSSSSHFFCFRPYFSTFTHSYVYLPHHHNYKMSQSTGTYYSRPISSH